MPVPPLVDQRASIKNSSTGDGESSSHQKDIIEKFLARNRRVFGKEGLFPTRSSIAYALVHDSGKQVYTSTDLIRAYNSIPEIFADPNEFHLTGRMYRIVMREAKSRAQTMTVNKAMADFTKNFHQTIKARFRDSKRFLAAEPAGSFQAAASNISEDGQKHSPRAVEAPQSGDAGNTRKTYSVKYVLFEWRRPELSDKPIFVDEEALARVINASLPATEQPPPLADMTKEVSEALRDPRRMSPSTIMYDRIEKALERRLKDHRKLMDGVLIELRVAVMEAIGSNGASVATHDGSNGATPSAAGPGRPRGHTLSPGNGVDRTGPVGRH